MNGSLVKINDGVWFLASMLDGSQPPIAPALGGELGTRQRGKRYGQNSSRCDPEGAFQKDECWVGDGLSPGAQALLTTGS